MNTKHWPIIHLPAACGTVALCGRKAPTTVIAWSGITCLDCIAEWTRRRVAR